MSPIQDIDLEEWSQVSENKENFPNWIYYCCFFFKLELWKISIH